MHEYKTLQQHTSQKKQRPKSSLAFAPTAATPQNTPVTTHHADNRNNKHTSKQGYKSKTAQRRTDNKHNTNTHTGTNTNTNTRARTHTFPPIRSTTSSKTAGFPPSAADATIDLPSKSFASKTPAICVHDIAVRAHGNQSRCTVSLIRVSRREKNVKRQQKG